MQKPHASGPAAPLLVGEAGSPDMGVQHTQKVGAGASRCLIKLPN